MFKYLTIWGLSLLMFAVSGNQLMFIASKSETYQETHKLLDAMDDVRRDSDKLAGLFKVGDERIKDLIQALDDPSKEISLRAQIVIRYLGNAEGMKALTQWYSKQSNEYPIAGPVPLPLAEGDYKFINLNLLGKAPERWGDRGVQYIYALAIEDTEKSKMLLDAMINSAAVLKENTFAGYAIKQVGEKQPPKLLPMRRDLAKLVIDHAFFVSAQDQKHASGRVLGFNGNKDKALVEVYINRGRLAEEWYHIVIQKCEQGWKFFSITQVAIS